MTSSALRPTVWTYGGRSVTHSPLHYGGVPLADDWSGVINGLHTDLLTVNQQLHLAALDTQRQLVPLSVEELRHPLEGAQHLCAVGTCVEEVQRVCVALETKAHLFPSLWVADLPQVPRPLGRLLSHLKCGNDGVVGGQAVWVHIAVARQ